ncbi:MAG: helix-turn-helix domain-containing protein [Ruminococcus sp.]|nr:helix-turn-helix domain-containing protein [Ruminococcus sp.]
MLYKNKLIYLREENNLIQTDVAKLLKVDRAVYGQYEREYQIIPLKHLITICDYYNVSLDYIFSFSNDKQYKNSGNIDKNLSGKRLKEFRKDNKITQLKLSSILNAGQPTIANYENGTYLIATPFLYTICSKYHISADYLLGKVDEPKYLK